MAATLDAAGAKGLARPHAAQQQRPRGPHPLPLFLDIVRRVVGEDRARLVRVLRAVDSYQSHAWRRALPAMPVLEKAGSACLRDYGGAGRPTLFVPSLVNPPSVLDLAEDRSLLRWLAERGVRPLLVDWGAPGTAERGLDVAGYVRERLLPLVEALGEPVDLVGYCLGGTMALAAAHHPRVARVATVAAPWDFAGYPRARRDELAAYWHSVRQAAGALGAMPMDLVQPAFWSLDPAGAVAKYERFAGMDPDSDAARAFIAVEDWANDGPPVALPAATECFDDFFAANRPGRGDWCADPAAAGKPILTVVSRTDRIVPAASAPPFGERLEIAAGHVGMVIGSGARNQLWEPLLHWLRARPAL
jgi:polyhydroxyalkanoate synthase subunit PhaC